MLQLLRKIAFPLSLLYAFAVLLRNALYNLGVFQSKSFRTPTICVGNLSIGGTGKTPMIEFLIGIFEGYSVAVLSRGYKRKSKGFLLAGPNSTVEDLGDEPFQLHRKFPECSIVVDADRRNGIAQLEQSVRPDVILLDDAYQHRKVKPSFSILLTTYDKIFVDDWYLPTGDLRDSKLEAKRANFIIVTKCPSELGKTEKNNVLQKIGPRLGQHVFFCTLDYGKAVKGDEGEARLLDDLRDSKIALVTGIAAPAPLVAYLQEMGLIFQHFEFGDHHYFLEKDIESFSGFETILTTEKDFVRLNGKVENLFYLEVAHKFEEEDGAFIKRTLLELL